MKIPKALSVLSFTFGTILSASANEYQFENIKLNQVENEQNIYQPKDKFGFQEKFIIFTMIVVLGIAVLGFIGGYLKIFDLACSAF